MDGVDGELQAWQTNQGFHDLPTDFIDCPLNEEQRRQYYSLEQVAAHELQPGSSYAHEWDALQSFLTNPPLNQVEQGGKKPRMAPKQASTTTTRQKVLSLFLGFCFKWLHLNPTMELVMKPMVVAKYMGFMKAKGLASTTMKKVSMCMPQWSHKLLKCFYWQALSLMPQPMPCSMPTTWP